MTSNIIMNFNKQLRFLVDITKQFLHRKTTELVLYTPHHDRFGCIDSSFRRHKRFESIHVKMDKAIC